MDIRGQVMPRVLLEQEGWTLVEVLVVLALTLVVFSAVLIPLESSGRVENRDVQWAQSLAAGRTGLQRMVRELRQAYQILGSTTNSIEFQAVLSGQDLHLFYECDISQPNTSYRECVRLQSATGTSLPALSTATPIVQNVVNGTVGDPVFAFTPDGFNPTFIEARVKLPASGELATSAGLSHTIALDDGAFLRNLSLS